ncbi:MAG: EamA family transporter [Desulfuromonas sp.]|nr:MAG: EamA family transporter [Desulfuromonas sp.]
MSTTAFILIVFSALMHAFWNLLVKSSHHKTVFIWWMFAISGSMFNIYLLLRPEPFPVPDLKVLALALGGSVCFVLYHLFNGRSYRTGDLSIAYPLSQTSMLYVPIWGAFLLKESLSPVGAFGILLVLAGAYVVQLPSLGSADILRPFRNLGNQSVQFALAAGFIYSVGSILDKMGVMTYSPLYFTHLMVCCMFVLMTGNLIRPGYRGKVREEWQKSRWLILLSGPVMMSSFLSFRFGLQMAPVSYAVPVRQVSLLIAVLIGVLFLGERCGRIRFTACSLILAGVFLIRIG